MPADDIYELTVGSNLDGAKLVNRFHYRQNNADGPNPAEEDLRDAWVTTILPLMRACMSNQAAVEVLRVRRVAPTEGGSYVFPIDEEGDINDESLPPNSVAVIALYSLTTNRTGRGRFHMSAYPETMHSDGILNAAMLVNYTALGDGMIPLLTVGGGAASFLLVIWGGVGTGHAIVDTQTRAYLHTLRSRRMASP